MTAMEDLFDASSLFEVLANAYNLLQTVSHGIFILIFLPLPFLAIWITTKKVIVPLVLYMIVGGAIAAIGPWELKKPAMVMLGFGLAGITANWFFRNR